jgi:hypothetical protein
VSYQQRKRFQKDTRLIELKIDQAKKEDVQEDVEPLSQSTTIMDSATPA